MERKTPNAKRNDNVLLLGAPVQGQDSGANDPMLGGPKVEKTARGDQSKHGRRRAKAQKRADRLFKAINATDEQKAAIKQRAEQMRQEMRKVLGTKRKDRAANAERIRDGKRRSGRSHRLTDEQRSQVKAIREAFRRDIRPLLDANQQAAFDEMAARREQAGRRGGKGHGRRHGQRDGMNGDERPGKRHGRRGGARRERMLERFDTNGDGELDDSERAAAREARDQRRNSRKQTI